MIEVSDECDAICEILWLKLSRSVKHCIGSGAFYIEICNRNQARTVAEVTVYKYTLSLIFFWWVVSTTATSTELNIQPREGLFEFSCFLIQNTLNSYKRRQYFRSSPHFGCQYSWCYIIWLTFGEGRSQCYQIHYAKSKQDWFN